MKVTLVNVGFMPNEADLGVAPPIGIMQLGAFLREKGHEVNLLDWSGMELDGAKREMLQRLRPDVVGLHVKISSALLRALEVSTWAREIGGQGSSGEAPGRPPFPANRSGRRRSTRRCWAKER